MFSLLGLVTGEPELDFYGTSHEVDDLISEGSLSTCSSDYSSSLGSEMDDGFSVGQYKIESSDDSSVDSVDVGSVALHVYR